MTSIFPRSLSIGIVLAGFSLGGTQAAVAYELKQTFLSSTAQEQGFFGSAVAGVGNNFLVGAFQEDAGATDAGRAYLFEGDPTSPTFGDLLATFQSPNPSPSGNFGGSVASVGNNILIGESFRHASSAEGQPGAAYLFDGNPASPTFGNLLKTFQAPNPSILDMLGFSVAGVGNNVLIGAFGNNTGATYAGAAFLFDGNPASATFGELLMTFKNPNPALLDMFGVAVTGVGNNVLIGAFRDDTTAIDAGIAYLFDGDPASPTFGQLLKTLENPNPSLPNASGQNDEFGHSVGSVGNNCLIGSFREDAGALDSGAAYLYDCNPASPTFGNLLATLNNPYPYNSENFGFSLAGLGNYALVGSWREHAKNYFAGAVYVYDAAPNSPTLGQLVGAFVSPNPTIYGSFGTSLAVAGPNVLIGAIGENAGAGAAYIYGPQSVSNLARSQGTAIAQSALLQPEVSTIRQLSADSRATPMPEPAAVPALFVLGAGGVWLGRKRAKTKRLVD